MKSELNYSEWVEKKVSTKGRDRLLENTLGLVGEAGEVAEKIKKVIRDGVKVQPVEVIKELGDVVFYVTALANYLGFNLQDVIDMNRSKLDDREARGVLKGSGDNR
jgi:NTP pyrophosphatase (non-canonical NTP hydrolase)